MFSIHDKITREIGIPHIPVMYTVDVSSIKKEKEIELNQNTSKTSDSGANEFPRSFKSMSPSWSEERTQ